MYLKKGVAIVVGLFLLVTLSAPASLAAEEQASKEVSAEAMVFDLLLVRPLGIVATVAGSVLYVVSLPFSAAGGNAEQAAQKLVVEPAKFTFARPLGEINF